MTVKELKKALEDKMDDDDVVVNVSLLIDYGEDYEELEIATDTDIVEGNLPVMLTTGWVELEAKHSYKFKTYHAQLAKGKDYKRRNIEEILLKRLAHMPWDKAIEFIAERGGKKHEKSKEEA